MWKVQSIYPQQRDRGRIRNHPKTTDGRCTKLPISCAVSYPPVNDQVSFISYHIIPTNFSPAQFADLSLLFFTTEWVTLDLPSCILLWSATTSAGTINLWLLLPHIWGGSGVSPRVAKTFRLSPDKDILLLKMVLLSEVFKDLLAEWDSSYPFLWKLVTLQTSCSCLHTTHSSCFKSLYRFCYYTAIRVIFVLDSLQQVNTTSSKSNALYFHFSTILLKQQKCATVLVLMTAFRSAFSLWIKIDVAKADWHTRHLLFILNGKGYFMRWVQILWRNSSRRQERVCSVDA